MSAELLALIDSAISLAERASGPLREEKQQFLTLQTKSSLGVSTTRMPAFGLGTWKSQKDAVFRAVEYALDCGIRHIDTAAGYANEKEIGRALRNKLGKVVRREDIFVTSKLWNSKHAPEDVEPALRQSLEDLQLECLDLYLIHWPITFLRKNPDQSVDYGPVVPIFDTWQAMERCVEKGLCKHIGLSNFNSVQVEEILDKGTIRPAVLQCENHPYLTTEKLVRFCEQRGIVFTAYSILGSGDRPWAKPSQPRVLEDPVLAKIAAKKSKSVAQICVRFQLQRGMSVLAKSVTPSRIATNFDVWDFELSDEEMSQIFALNKNFRTSLVPDPKEPMRGGKVNPRDRIHPNWPFNIEF